MAHHVEPMDVDNSICDFDDKENSLHHSNVLAKGLCTEKGYEELEVSELNMKLRYSITPTSSPMSKSFTANCIDNKQYEAGDNNIINAENANLTRSMNSAITRSDSIKKVLPLQCLPTDQFIDSNRNALRPLEPTVDLEKDITVSGPNNLDEQLSIPSSSSSLAHTPEATTPTKEFNKQDGGSPIMRGLKSVLSMFRPSQSPIATTEDAIKPEVLSPPVIISPNTSDTLPSTMLVSTPLAAQKTALSKREVSNRDSIVFKDDLENELEWKDESTIIFSTEKVPIHKLFMTQNKPVQSKSSSNIAKEAKETEVDEKLDSTVEYMDISYNDSIVQDKTATGIEEITNKNDNTNVTESDSEFLDCETTFTKSENKNDVSLHIKQDCEVKEGQNMTVTNESLNDQLSNTLDSLTLSTDNTKTSVTIENDVTPVASVVEEQVDSAEEEITVNQMVNTCQSSKSLSEPDAEPLLTIKATEQKSPACDIELDIGSHTYSDTNKIDNNIQNIDTITSSVGNNKLSENIVVSSLSQIPLIADPRVLLFNIPDATSETVQTMHNIEEVNTTPADIPFPDDEDLEKVEVNEETGKGQQVSMDDSPKTDIIEQRLVDETLCTKLSEIVSSSEKIPINDEVKNKLDEQYEEDKTTKPVQLEKEDANEIKVIEVDISTNTNTTENLPEVDHVEHKDHVLNQYAVNEVSSIHEVEINSLHNVMFSKTGINNLEEHLSVKNDGLPLQETKEISPSRSEIEHRNDFIQNETDDVTKTDFTVKAAEILPSTLERVLDDKINSQTLNLKDEKQSLVKGQTVPELRSTVEEIDILDATSIQNETKNLCKSSTNDEITRTDENFHEHLTKDNLKQDVGIEISNSSYETILEKQIQQEKDTCKNNFTEISQDIVQIKNKLADEISETSNEIVASIESPILNSIKQEETLPQTSVNVLSTEIVSTTEAKVESDVEDAIVASKDNSPFVTISTDDLEGSSKSQENYNFENADNTKTKIENDLSPPLSPKIVSKGYNLNFDEIEDPFATNTKIRLSPSRDCSPNESFENIVRNVAKPKSDMIKNRRNSHPRRKRPANTKNMNSTFSGSSKTSIDKSDKLKQIPKETETISMGSLKSNEISIINHGSEKKEECNVLSCENFKPLQTGKEADNTFNKTQDLEVLNESKNVFNLPEIDDANFNPFVTKSNVRQSPVQAQQSDDPFATTNKTRLSPVPNNNSEKTEVKYHNETNQQANFETKCPLLEEHNLSHDASNITCSSKADDKDITVREVHTEDEDTVEGPFLETEGQNHDDKMSDFGGENLDVMQFSELPTQENENQEAGELFIDAEAFDFLLNQNKANEVLDSGKESLFLKFDPLYSKRISSGGVVAALNSLQNKKQSTPKKIAEFSQNDITLDKSSVTEHSTINFTQETHAPNVMDDSTEGLNLTVTKPMMVVNPAVNPIPAPRNTALTPVRSNRQSLTFTSPAIAVIDRLLSMSANNSLIGHEVSVTNVRGHTEADLALTQLRELLADKEISVYNLKSESKELKERLSTLESQVKSLEALSEERLKKINDLTEKLAEKTKINKSMASVVEEYERTIASLISETEQDRKRHAEERLQLINERDEQTRHLASMEVSFSDLHSKYEKSKQVIFGFKANEDSLKKNIKDFEENLAKAQTNYELLKQHATSKLNHANEELQKMNRAHETEVMKLNAMIKRQELHITSLEETLLQKTKANEELTAICDELINRVG